MNAIEGVLSSIKALAKRVGRLEIQDKPTWVYLDKALTSISFDGDSFSTTAKTGLDLSAAFGAPAGIKAVLFHIELRDSGSAAATTTCWALFSPDNTAGTGIIVRIAGVTNDAIQSAEIVVPCNINGDVYYQIDASGATTLDIWLKIWGYLI
jgi:hypothetical protein